MGLVARHATMLLGGVALSAILGASGAFAQATTDNTNANFITLLERIVIGAGKAKVAIETPQAVTVIDQADIDAKQASTIGEILDDTPGITMIGSERVVGESFNIRGIGAAETSGDEARIILTVDGARKFYEQYRMGSFFSEPELYKQVEVLRGPASSTLYGAGAMGGVVNFTTKDASDFIEDGMTGAVRAKTSYDSNGNGTLVSGILAHRINETFEVLASGNIRQSDIQQLANGNDLIGSEFEAWSGLVKGTIHLDAEQVVRLSYQKWSTDNDDQYYSQTGDTGSAFGTIDRAVTDQTAIISYENPAEANEMLDLKVQLSFSNTDVSQSDPSDPSLNNFSNIIIADYGYATTQFNVENTSEFYGDNWENFLTYGVQASQQIRTAEPIIGNLITTHPEGTSTALGIFAQSEQTWNDNFTVIAGARVDFSTLETESTTTPTQIPDAPGSSEDTAFSPKLAALYKFNDNLNVFGSLAHTERMPTLDEMYQYTLVSSGPNAGQYSRTPNLNLEKESSDNIELGFGTQAQDILTSGDSVGFKATAFHNTITNGIQSNPITSAGNPYFINITGMRIWGLELEGSYESEMAFVRLAYTYTRGEYTEDLLATNPANNIYAGDDVRSIPQDKLVLTVGGRAPELNLEYGTRVTLAADPLTAVATTPASPVPDGWAKVDVFASWKPEAGPLEGLEATLGIDNLFDADYRENLSMDRSKGRTFKLTLSKQFDY
jgi:hemoglobin/transferrin/lactoferrin receptor protein